jgi:hypothetical protein
MKIFATTWMLAPMIRLGLRSSKKEYHMYKYMRQCQTKGDNNKIKSTGTTKLLQWVGK